MTTKSTVSLLVLALCTFGCAFDSGEDVAAEREFSSESPTPQIEAPPWPTGPSSSKIAAKSPEGAYDDVAPSFPSAPGTSFDDVAPSGASGAEPGEYDDVAPSFPAAPGTSFDDVEPEAAAPAPGSTFDDVEPSEPNGEAPNAHDDVEPTVNGVPCFWLHPTSGAVVVAPCSK
jgi:hypothetical protein